MLLNYVSFLNNLYNKTAKYKITSNITTHPLLRYASPNAINPPITIIAPYFVSNLFYKDFT